MDNDNSSDRKEEKKDSFLKSKWKSLPPTVKLQIIGGIMVVLILIISIVGVVSMIPSIFLDFSKEAEKSDDIGKEYEEFWDDLCEEGDENCSQEQIERDIKIKKSQTKFFKKLNALSEKYDLTEEQKYIVLTTIFFNYEIDDFTEDNGAFSVDETDEIDYEDPKVKEENGRVIYIQEYDSLKELIKQFKVNTAYCQKVRYNENSEPITENNLLYDSENNTFSFNFFESAFFGVRKYPDKKGFAEARELCELSGGSVYLENSTSSQASIDGFYRYLINSDYLDKKDKVFGEFKAYGTSHNLPQDLSSWPEEDLKAVREEIVDEIKEIVEEYMKENGGGGTYIAKSGSSYWWPIGSKEATPNEDGILFAAGPPEFTHINSHYGMRVHPVNGTKKLHNGIDLKGSFGTTYIIASLGGTVIDTNNTCVSYSDRNNKAQLSCGGGFGNYVKIQDNKGNINIYAHLYRDSLTVSKGDKVSQGQVLGRIGSSGSSTGPHLHFTMIVNGAAVNPIDYIDPIDNRPSSAVDFNNSRYSKEEFIAKLNDYYSSEKSCQSGNVDTTNDCKSFREQILSHDGARIIYESATAKNINPEILVARAMEEGYSPGTGYNYYGFKCYNTGGPGACSKFMSFEEGVNTFINNISSRYDSVESMMSKYTYLGDYWYTGKNWGLGGCAYAELIYPDGMPDRVKNACNHEDDYCTKDNTSRCTPTTEEDKSAFASYQASKMAKRIKAVFG